LTGLFTRDRLPALDRGTAATLDRNGGRSLRTPVDPHLPLVLQRLRNCIRRQSDPDFRDFHTIELGAGEIELAHGFGLSFLVFALDFEDASFFMALGGDDGALEGAVSPDVSRYPQLTGKD
jgi:hypothetical protein